MPARTRPLTLPLALLGAALLALAAAAPADAKPKGKGKNKPVKCKGDKIVVKQNGKKRCRALGKVLPAPQDVDQRLAAIEAALDVKVKRDRRGRRIKPLKKKARKALLGTASTALAGLDGLIQGRARRQARGPGAAAAAADCPEGQLPSSTYTESSGGIKVQAGFNGDGSASIGIDFDQGGYTYRFKYETGAPCARNEVPRCPTAAGVVDSSDSRHDAITVEVLKGGQLVSSQKTTIARQTKLHGQVADDAKLDYLDVDDVWKMDVQVQGEGSGSTRLKGTIKRHTRVDMRTGRYDPGEASVSFSGPSQLTKADDKGFAAAVSRAIAKYRVAEYGWNEENKCAKIEWSPDYLTLTLRKGQRGQFTGRVDARDPGPPYYGGGGGTATDGRWSVTEQTNVTVSPTSGRGGTSSFGIVPTAVGDNVATSARFKVTSTAGVAERAYAVKTKDVPTINEIAGNFNQTTDFFGSVLTVTGSATFTRFTPAIFGGADGFYGLTAGGYTVQASGREGLGISACQQSGSENFTFPPNSGSMSVHGTPPELGAPYEYSFEIFHTEPGLTMDITFHSCPPGAEDLEGTVWQLPVALEVTTEDLHPSADGITYQGSESTSGPNFSLDESWTFTGQTAP